MSTVDDPIGFVPAAPEEPEGEPAESARPPGILKDFVTLAKPGITAMCLFTAAGAMAYAWATGAELQQGFGWQTIGWSMLGTALSVVGSNALNMVIEREGDKAMVRTRNRPLPSGRMHVGTALAFGVITGCASFWVLWYGVNPLTSILSMIALGSYVFVYTPLKRVTPQALAIGAIPGAMPPLIGWTSATDRIDPVGLVLFLILLLWQLPHFLAIALYRFRDYQAAGIKTVPVVRGIEVAKVQSVVYSLLMFPVSLMLIPLGAAQFVYFFTASVLGIWFFILSARGFEPGAGVQWARSFFLASLIYLPVLTVALALDVVIR